MAARELDLILVTAPDRLARHYVHQVLLLEEIEKASGEERFLDRPMSSDPHDQLLLQIRGAVAEYERTLIAERMRRGKMMRLKAGLLLPWSKATYGYRLGLDHPRDPAGVHIDEQVATVWGWPICCNAKERSLPEDRGGGTWPACAICSHESRLYGTGVCRPRAPAQTPARLDARQSPVAALSGVDPGCVGFRHDQSGVVRPRTGQAGAESAFLASAQHRASVSVTVAGPMRRVRAVVPGLPERLRSHVLSLPRQAADNPILSRPEVPGTLEPSPAQPLDDLVWNDLCSLLVDPAQIRQALERAQGGHWLPQELQTRRDGLRRAQSSLEQEIERLTEAYLGGVVGLEEYRRWRRSRDCCAAQTFVAS